MDADTRFGDYVNRYCKTYNVSVDAAINHKIVQEVKRYYEEEESCRIADQTSGVKI